VYITQFGINEKEMRTDTTSVLPHDQNNCRISYVGVSMRGGQGIRYRYMLEGLDEFWQNPTLAKSITYAALKPGKYRFVVKAINGDGVESATAATIAFVIDSPYWMQWWFLIACTILLGAFGALALRIRERRLVEIERIRARIAADLHDDIGSGLVRIALLSDVIRRQAAAAERAGLGPPSSAPSAGGYSIASSTDRVGTIARELVDAMSDVVWSIDPRHDAFDLLAHRIETLATELCEAKGIRLAFAAQEGGHALKPGSTSIRTVLLILKESLTNIVRHAQCSSVEITLGYLHSPDRLRIAIHDDGVGFDPGRLPRVNGLENMKLRSAKAGGTFHVISASGTGTMIEAEIPVSS
jgi:signal transduction histidine kinase